MAEPLVDAVRLDVTSKATLRGGYVSHRVAMIAGSRGPRSTDHASEGLPRRVAPLVAVGVATGRLRTRRRAAWSAEPLDLVGRRWQAGGSCDATRRELRPGAEPWTEVHGYRRTPLRGGPDFGHLRPVPRHGQTLLTDGGRRMW